MTLPFGASLLLVLLLAGMTRGQALPGRSDAPQDWPATLANLSEIRRLEFSPGDFKRPSGGHVQGVQLRYDADANRYLAFLSHDSTTAAYLVIVAFPPDLAGPGAAVALHTFPGDGRMPPLRHAGGIQLLDDLLVVGLEDNQNKTRSQVQFWNVENPHQPAQLEHLTIARSGAPKEKTAGAVGIVRRPTATGVDHVLAVANWDSRAIDFYRSNGKPLDDANCRFTLHATWRVDTADKSAWQPDKIFGQYQAVNLAADAAGGLWLFGFGTAAFDNDRVDLYAVDLDAPPAAMLRKLSSKHLALTDGCHFRSGGGLSFLPDGPAILASPRNLDVNTRLNVSR